MENVCNRSHSSYSDLFNLSTASVNVSCTPLNTFHAAANNLFSGIDDRASEAVVSFVCFWLRLQIS